MKACFHVFLLVLTLWIVTACTSVSPPMAAPSPVVAGPELRGLFEGITPCSGLARPLPQIPADTDCEQMIWKLTLYQDPGTGAPTTYSLKSAYGLPKQNTNDLVGGGTPIEMEGTWTITTGTRTDPDAVVYQLNPGDPQTRVSFLKVSDHLLHVLNSEKSLLVGNGAWSYTLNRMEDQDPVEASPNSSPDPPTRPPLPPVPAGSSVFRIFEGRVPCHEIVVEVMKVTPVPGCLKIKWRITLYQDDTGAPSTYLSMGTSTFREGSWTIIRGMDGDPEAVIYQLQLDNEQQPVSFLRVDENNLFLMDRDMNLLVGNQLFSYTLSRVDPGTQ